MRITPFYRSKPSPLTIVAICFLIPYTPIGSLFQFVAPPFEFLMALVGIIAAYPVLVEVVNFFFFCYYARGVLKDRKNMIKPIVSWFFLDHLVLILYNEQT
jgi:hypothetical protein